MLTRACGRCDGKGMEPGSISGQPCVSCNGSGRQEVPEDPAKPYLPSRSDGLMTIDPPISPEKKAAGRRAMETCGKCKCCRRWKAKILFTNRKGSSALANAQKWAGYWKSQYEKLSAAKKQDQPKT